MRTFCHTSLAFTLKFLNFLQTFVGVSIIVYSLWMLNQWNHRIPISPPPAPSPDSPHTLFLSSDNVRVSDQIIPLNFAADMVSGFDADIGLHFVKLPAPWFIYSFMAVGVLVCCITCIGHIAAEAVNGCCLCFYTLLTTVLILLEAAFVAFIALDRNWEKDLPFDPTGELDSLRSFIGENVDICKWVGITMLIIQALSLLLALILRAMVSTRRGDYDCEDGCTVEDRREPLLNPQSIQTSGSTKGDARSSYSDIWSSRIREKYGLNSGDAKYNVPNQNTSMNMKSKQ
ncbi:hypothetical protein L1049_004915 [Liquidambar formosana]|uniref:Uncharacterized protein n=1 Tax=Liquidambar formosana TaxID=63359 RepID=A0AAP0RTW2_LIQFO